MIHPLDRLVSPEDEPVRVAVVGLGYWGPNLVRNLNEHPGRGGRRGLRPASRKLSRRWAAVSVSQDDRGLRGHSG